MNFGAHPLITVCYDSTVGSATQCRNFSNPTWVHHQATVQTLHEHIWFSWFGRLPCWCLLGSDHIQVPVHVIGWPSSAIKISSIVACPSHPIYWGNERFSEVHRGWLWQIFSIVPGISGKDQMIGRSNLYPVITWTEDELVKEKNDSKYMYVCM